MVAPADGPHVPGADGDLAEETQNREGQPDGREHGADRPADEPGLQVRNLAARFRAGLVGEPSPAGDTGRVVAVAAASPTKCPGSTR